MKAESKSRMFAFDCSAVARAKAFSIAAISAISLLAAVSATSASAQTLAKRGGIDLDGANKSALIVRSASGQLQAGRLVGGQFSFSAIPDPGAAFRLVGAPDFDGNGVSDLAFQNTTTGEFGEVKRWRDFVPAQESVVRQVKQVWDVQAVGDLDGDGRGDLVWRYVVANSPDTGVSYIWFTNQTGEPFVRKRGGAPLSWKLLGAQDLNGDSAADMLYVSPDGSIRALMATPGRTCANLGAGAVPANFSAVAYADFTGRGRGDVLFRNPTNGQMQLASLNATGLTLPPYTGNPNDRDAACTSSSLAVTSQAITLPASDPSWQIFATGDFNGDGVFDIVWLKGDGNLAMWQMAPNGAAPTVVSTVGTLPVGFSNFQGTTDQQTSVATKNARAASRFLAQATFGPTQTQIDRVNAIGMDAWITEQFNMPQTKHLPNAVAWLATRPPDMQNGQTGFQWSMWKNFSSAEDQLRQRVAYSLSQIFVISLNSNLAFAYPRGPANYLDMLGEKGFGNFRDLLEGVTYSPMMGIYLSHMRNQKEDPATGRVPDENYAREVMQLFTIGVYQLNIDGTYKRTPDGKPIETYTNADTAGLAKVFTGLSWAGPDTSTTRFGGGNADPDRQILPMQAYNQFHSTSQKSFLGVTIPAQTPNQGQTNADVKIALDTLFNHPNVGPFISAQLIQRLVSSNPSTDYIARVATVFNNNGAGVRGDMKAVIRAILMDPEARDPGQTTIETGKLREPVVRLVNWMRAFNARSTDGRYLLGSTSDPSTQLAQSPMSSPSVFNFYRPGYVPPNTLVGAEGLVAPEFQITTETSVAGYLNFMRGVVQLGVGGTVNNARDIQPNYSAEIALAHDPDALIDRINLLLTTSPLSQASRLKVRNAVASVPIGTTNPDNDRRNRVYLAIYLLMASPEYILQN
jgi:uncharacterized protein (DUF1800 family)